MQPVRKRNATEVGEAVPDLSILEQEDRADKPELGDEREARRTCEVDIEDHRRVRDTVN